MPIVNFFKKQLPEWLGLRKELQASPHVKAKFLLTHHDLLIGTLSVSDGIWQFEYSDEFRRDGSYRPIVEFPDVNETYRSPMLWQFFASRIPSLEQAEVEEILKREQIEEDDAVRLLQRFGKRTITNPFQLDVAA
ncbi:MAG: HipA N-terminal domain-containing protein [Acidobacteria bacterium]|nr:HipA N-terminal domain-containing protein [Acidobacteriota bacterium]